MNTNIQATNIELTPAINDYVEKKIASFDRFISAEPEAVHCAVEVGKTTHHHRQGEYFKAEINLRVSGNTFYAVSEKEDLYAAIDEVKDEIVRKLTSHKNKSETLYRKGALKFKNMIKGLDPRQWRR